MKIEALQQALNDPSALDKFPTEDLVRLTEQYPWFAAAQLLLTRKLKWQNDHRYTDQLHQAAVHTPGQEVLFNLVHGPETYTTPAAEAVPPPPAIVPVPVPEVVEPAMPVLQPAAPAPPAAVAPVTATPPPPEASAKTIDPLQQEVLVEAIQSSISMEVSGQEAPVGARETADQTEEIGQTEDDYSRWLATRAASLSYLNAPASARPADEEAMGVADWQRPEPVRETEPEPETKQSDNQEDNSKNSHQRALVDRFIKFEPKITPGKADEYMTGNIARASIEEDPEIVSETIADLYVKQGKIDRARKAYRKLMELYPEKSIYFAVRLKNLDKNKK